MKHLKHFGKAMLAAAVVLKASEYSDKLPEQIKVGSMDLRPYVVGGGALFGVMTVAGMVLGKKAAKLVPTP